jgi:hypothetical protein
MTNKNYYLVAELIFVLITLLHVCRIIFGWDAWINDVYVPMWASGLAVIVAGYMTYWTWKISK